MRRALIVLGMAAVLITASISEAQIRDWLTGNVSKNSSTVTDFLAAVERTGTAPAYRDELRRLRANVGLVFVPGILGSALKSGTGEEIWGYSLRMTDGLRLPPALVDPDAASDVRATIADGNGTLNLYGDAMAMIRASAVRAGIAPHRIAACGYDWRRDIRAGARDLKRCIETSPELKGIEALIVIAHSMGGLVAFQWHRENAPNGVLGDGTPVIAVATLGSPLAGSCEIVRMISTGYMQPTANERHARESWVGRFWTDVVTMKDRVVNTVTGFFTDDVRPLVLTWPGALGICPPAARTKDDPNCAAVPSDPDNDLDPGVLSQYDEDFWRGATGSSLLSGKPLPDGYEAALSTSRDFRSSFRLEPLASPTYLFASEVWDTPAQAKLVPPRYELDDRGGWHTADGDGRVPYYAAMPTAIQVRAADARRLYSVHGNLPEDKIFHEEFFVQRVPRLLNGWYAVQLMTKAAGDQAFLRAYAAEGGRQVHPYDLLATYERQTEDKQRDPVYALTVEAWNAAVDFNDAMCGVSACPDYAQAKKTAANVTNAEKAAILSAAMRTPEGLSADDELFLRAKRGLTMAMQLNWIAAIGDLRFAVPKLEARYQRLGTKEKQNERELRVNATANLARALVMRGFCDEAKPYVKSIPPDNRWAVDLGKAQCFDRDTGKIVSLR
ncbi:MAG: lipase/acyltransferase domain-containing protein [Syntrophales bacterium]